MLSVWSPADTAQIATIGRGLAPRIIGQGAQRHRGDENVCRGSGGLLRRVPCLVKTLLIVAARRRRFAAATRSRRTASPCRIVPFVEYHIKQYDLEQGALE